MGGIIWLASYPKSGNTWLRAFLHNLLRDPDQPAEINKLDQFCVGDSQAKWFSHVANGRKPMDMSPEEVAPLRPLVHQAFTSAHPDSVFAKTHNIMAEAYGVPLVTMEYTVGAIYIVRNPLDMVLSLADHFGQSLDGAIAMLADPQAGTPSNINNAFEFYGTWSQHVAAWTAVESDALIRLRYEDMGADPRQTFRKVANFLGLDPPSARLDKAIQFSSFEVLRAQEDKSGFRERSSHSEHFFRSGKSGQWHGVLSKAQVDAVVSAHHEQMERFGYLP
ncbi:MAG: sulfotransferase domain-containing protein [Alphaproteobacteria bacterium]|nr:sulfotransferase domain-containing protein [Alphaproteobacteria bacterium]